MNVEPCASGVASRASAPVGPCFIAVEGEGRRVGQVTCFVHLANGPWQRMEKTLALPVCQQPPVVVLDVCECAWFDWSSYAVDFASLLRHEREIARSAVHLVLETRGERACVEKAVAAFDEVYLNHSPGFTLPEWTQASETLQVKRLLSGAGSLVNEARDALLELMPYYARGHEVYVAPRVDWSHNEARNRVANLLVHFPRMALDAGMPLARCILIEHEVAGSP